MEQTPPRVPKLAWVKEEEEAAATSAQQPGELEQLQLLQEGAAMDWTQEQDPARGRFRRAAQMICEFIVCVWREETTGVGTGPSANFHLFSAETSAAMLDLLVEKGVSNPKQVPAMVKYIHKWLTANESAGHRLDKALLELTKEHPYDVLMTLLRWAPSGDRAAAAMWGVILTSTGTAEPALQILITVLSAWPVDTSVYTSDGDSTGVFALAATVTLWNVFNWTWCPPIVLEYSPSLFLRLLFQAFISTLYTPEVVDTFWKECQEQLGLATNPQRFAVQTLKVLLCRVQCEHVVLAMERKGGWDTLLYAGTHHYAVGLLAREMHGVSVYWHHYIMSYLLELLSQGISDWELPAMAFLVELLEFVDFSKWADGILEIMPRHLQSESKEMQRLALRGLVVLSRDPSMNKRMHTLTERLVDLLRDADEEIVETSAVVLSALLLHRDLAIPSPIALRLAAALWPLLDNIRLCVPSHGQWELPPSVVSHGFPGLCTERPGAADVEGFCFFPTGQTPSAAALHSPLPRCDEVGRGKGEKGPEDACEQEPAPALLQLPQRERARGRGLSGNAACCSVLPQEEGSGASGADGSDVEVWGVLAGTGQGPSGRAPAAGPAVPAEPTGAPARGGRPLPGAGRAVPERAAARVAAPEQGPSGHGR
ncbi:uncharacterized protein LOC130265064 [Oenanthe melanoleuca]|uniref:uncharacterized protein LOC130265064 n=1 Tax=Oenanthe melanoleuca TaxID=2939378 RepID=UPI0024C1BCAB|nr:uncharacterized protein LOC130265064 [Oenanthe melanoleuca]